jgi:DNA repair photolyase
MSTEGEYRDALPHAPAKGRASGLNPGNRFETVRLHVLGEALDEAFASGEAPPKVPTRIIADRTRTIINRVDSPDLNMNWTLNPYRGCEHGCIYCYARPTHENLGYSCGLDFETNIVAKHDAPRLLRKELSHPKWTGEWISMSGVTDCYQPAEKELRITRQCLKIFAECRQPVGIVTKSALVLRDVDVLVELAHYNAVAVFISVTSLDNRLASSLEPRAGAPQRRLETIARLSEAGIPTGVMIAPIIPGLTDVEIPAILEAARDAGATHAGHILLRLPWQVKDLFVEWLTRIVPDRAAHITSLIRQTHDGALYDSDYAVRHHGEGPVAEQIGTMFKTFAKRYGFDKGSIGLSSRHFRPPREDARGQMGLF